MDQHLNLELRKAAINRLANEARLPDVASALGIRVISRSTPPKALCPFHNDEHPSLCLYPSTGGGRAQFHCFACGAHGDVFDLIKKQLGTDFRGALDWLSARYGIPIPAIAPDKRRRDLQPRLDGLAKAFDLFRAQSAEEFLLLENWSAQRHFNMKVFEEAEVFAVLPPKIASHVAEYDREQVDALEASGLFRREVPILNQVSNFLPLDLPGRDFFESPRIIFTIRDDRGVVVGFAGRALEHDTPKYLFSPGFTRSATLYRWHRVRSNAPSTSLNRGDVKHVFVVEGLMDALRLESLGIDAVAALGSNLTTNQVRLLTDYAKELDRSDGQLAVHLLFDADEAGRRGMLAATVKLLNEAAVIPSLLVDVISPPNFPLEKTLGGVHDPDEIFRDLSNTEDALSQLRAWSRSPMSVLLSAATNVIPAELDSTWSRLSDSQKLRAFRDVERRIEHRATWIALIDRVPIFESHWGESIQPSQWREPLSAFLRASASHLSTPIVPIGSAERDDDARLIRALQIAQASAQRREFPLDEGSWDRLTAAADASLAHLKDLLAKDFADVESDPMLPVKVPKRPEEFRFKALPSPEILTLQQYVLNELLRDYSDCPRFQRLLPGVRFSRVTGGRKVETTGSEKIIPSDGQTVSFAYMLDMDVIEQRAAPQRTGMFRSYYECWQDFIAFIDNRLSKFPSGDFHVARLDIRRFYDSVPRTAINAVLLPAVSDGLAELADSSAESAEARECAPLFLPSITQPGKRAEALVDWLCDHSFKYLYEHPGTGEFTRGHSLPQGPDLSAYLANISLFPMDRVLSEIVADIDRSVREQGDRARCGAVYARYVDDMIIIARSATDLSRLRSAIEKELSLVGMELNPKTDPLPVMNESDVREWLTDRRGAGLGVSGPFDGPPVSAPLALVEPLAEAGDIDRSDSLLILYDPRLEEDLEPDELQDAIFTVRRTKDLRHGEQVACARHLWRCVLNKNPDATPERILREMISLWEAGHPDRFNGDGVPRRSSEFDLLDRDKISISRLLALLDGITRLLGNRPDRRPNLSDQQHASRYLERTYMASLVHDGLCELLIEHSLPASGRSSFLHTIELKALEIHCAAAYVSPVRTNTPDIPYQPGKSRAKARLLISIAEAQRSTTLLDRAGWRVPDVPLVLLFHEAIARLRISNDRDEIRLAKSQAQPPEQLFSGTLQDPLIPLKGSIELWSQKEYGSGPSLLRTLELWMPEADPVNSQKHSSLARAIALGTLVNLAPRKVIELLDYRVPLKSFALGEASRLIPTPPGIDVPGLVGLDDDDQTVLRADFWSELDRHFVPTLPWQPRASDASLDWKISHAPLKDFNYLAPRTTTNYRQGTLRWLARAFRSLVELTRKSGELACPPTAVNLLGPAIGNETDASKWGILGFCTSKLRIAGQAFLRFGTGGLILEPVLEQHDGLWRIGTALADWLGRADASRSLSQRLAAPSRVTAQQDDWATEAMLRFSLYRLRGSGLPTKPLRISEDSHLPITVERLLRRLESFPDGSGMVTLAHLLATLGESRAIQARLNSRLDPDAMGSGVALLTEIVRAQFHTDEELAKQLPNPDRLPDWAPLRRPARSWLTLAQRLALLAEADPQHNFDPTLEIVATGTRLLALEANLRAQALELWSLVMPSERENFFKMPPSLVEWGLDAEAVLRYQQTVGIQNESTGESASEEQASSQLEWHNTRDLFQQLYWATLEGQRVQWSSLASVTPLGWLVVIGSLTGVLGGEWRGSLAGPSGLKEEGFANLKQLATNLAVVGDDTDDLPWGGLKTVINTWTAPQIQRAFESLRDLDTAVGLDVRTIESSRLHIEGSRRGPTEVQTSDGLRQLQGWTISWAKTRDENRGGTERVKAVPGELKPVLRWSETWRGERLVSIGVVQSAMSALAGPAFSEPAAEIYQSPSTEVANSKEVKNSKPSLNDTLASHTGKALDDGMIYPQSVERLPKASGLYKEIGDALVELQIMQDRSWESRQAKSNGHARVALLQWDVDESYLHPAFELCSEGKTNFNPKRPGDWNELRQEASCAEARRRSVLKESLKACNRFKVDILLLPEYSVRPETVDWLHSNLSNLAPTTSVWAGTYRLPPGMSKSPYKDWSAVHELVLPEDSASRHGRMKKYPAVAAGEIFHPGTLALAPLFEDKLNDARSHTLELICSEVFLATCPANLLPLARSQRELLRKFGVGTGGTDLDLIYKTILEDIKLFASYTGISEHRGIRRTILLVPAMTSRTADYTVLGQAAYLASGLTTVFCNAVCGRYGHGQSCFIGHDCWQAEQDHTGHPSVEPYHGERPGIFRLDRGQLRKEEQALLIADIDPFYAFEGKPRPQMLAKPLQLVAHLPLIEARQVKSGMRSFKCRCHNTDHSFSAAEFAPGLLKALRKGNANVNYWKTTAEDPDPGFLTNALWQLAKPPRTFRESSQTNSYWLRRRAQAYLSGHLADPTPWPPPVAVDWLWIDERGNFENYPQIEAPAYAEPDSYKSSRNSDS